MTADRASKAVTKYRAYIRQLTNVKYVYMAHRICFPEIITLCQIGRNYRTKQKLNIVKTTQHSKALTRLIICCGYSQQIAADTLPGIFERIETSFSNGLKMKSIGKSNSCLRTHISSSSFFTAGPANDADEEEEFNAMLGQLGILGLIDDDEALRDMWINLRKDNDPTLMANFEEFLAKLSRDLHRYTRILYEQQLFGQNK